MAGYAEVMDVVFNAWQDIPFTENYIKQLHQILLKYSDKDAWHRGQYKTSTNSVAAFNERGEQIGVVFETASPFDTPRLMTELVNWVNEQRESKLLHPLLIAAIFVVVFLEIHPFQDGNGRLSRALTTLMLLQAGYAYVPYSSLESVIELCTKGHPLYVPRDRHAQRILTLAEGRGSETILARCRWGAQRSLWTGRSARRSAEAAFITLSTRLLKESGHAVGTPESLLELAARRQARYLRGMTAARKMMEA